MKRAHWRENKLKKLVMPTICVCVCVFKANDKHTSLFSAEIPEYCGEADPALCWLKTITIKRQDIAGTVCAFTQHAGVPGTRRVTCSTTVSASSVMCNIRQRHCFSQQ